jgi:hypothetical protein
MTKVSFFTTPKRLQNSAIVFRSKWKSILFIWSANTSMCMHSLTSNILHCCNRWHLSIYLLNHQVQLSLLLFLWLYRWLKPRHFRLKKSART